MALFITIYTVVWLVYLCLSVRRDAINHFKIAYYETKLENRGIDIQHIKNITLWKIITSKR